MNNKKAKFIRKWVSTFAHGVEHTTQKRIYRRLKKEAFGKTYAEILKMGPQ